MKKGLLLGAVLLALAAALTYHARYPVEADGSDLAAYTAQFLDHGKGNAALYEPIRLYDAVDLGKQRFVLMELGADMDLGEICLTRGWNGRYRIDSVGWGGRNFREEVRETGGTPYWLIGGRNSGGRIGKITVKFDGREYAVDVPEQEHFLVFTELDRAPEIAYADVETLRFYDRSGADITEEVLRN